MTDTALFARVLANIVARTTPLTETDATILMELMAAGWNAIRTIGQECPFGREGASLCVPDKWTADEWPYHARVCSHCPVFEKAH